MWDDLDEDGKTKNALSFRETGLHIKTLDYVHDDNDFKVFVFTKFMVIVC